MEHSTLSPHVENTRAVPRGHSPRAELTRLLMAQVVSQAIYVAAKLGIADLLAAGPRPVDDLAAATQTHAGSLARVLRALAGVGIFAEVRPGCYGLTPLADCLRDDRPDSARPSAILYGEEYRWAIDDLLWSVRTGESAFEQAQEIPFFAYLERHPEVGARFDRNMSGRFAARNGAVAAAYDFAPIATLVDLGGGEGGLLRAILTAHPAPRGVLFDRPPVIERVRDCPADPSLNGRLELAGGDFFEVVPPGADGYLLAAILHDWNDARATAILRTVRRAIAPGGRLLLVEEVLPPGNVPSPGKFLDLMMLVLVGGKERTAEEFRALLAGAGFALTGIVPTAAGPSVIEAVPDLNSALAATQSGERS